MLKCGLVLLVLLVMIAGSAGAEAFVYGQSELGRDLLCHRLGREDAPNTLLMVFGVHGFEDAYDHDGQMLKDIAETIIRHFEADASALGDYQLYIIPTANPDGLEEGETAYGFGRGNAHKLDINRDFPVDWERQEGVRNRTGNAPLATAEARAIKALVERIRPTYGVDVHGWLEWAYGDEALCRPFCETMDLPMGTTLQGGQLYQWLGEVTQASALIELPERPERPGYLNTVSQQMIQAVTILCGP